MIDNPRLYDGYPGDSDGARDRAPNRPDERRCAPPTHPRRLHNTPNTPDERCARLLCPARRVPRPPPDTSSFLTRRAQLDVARTGIEARGAPPVT